MPNPYDQLIEEEESDRAATTVALQHNRTPADVARAQRLSRYLDAPAALIEHQPQGYVVEDRRQGAAAAMRREPGLAGWLANPTNAAIAQNDIPSLERVSNILRPWSPSEQDDFLRSIGTDTGGAAAARAAIGATMSTAPSPRRSSFARPSSRSLEDLASQPAPGEAPPINWSLTRGLRGGASMLGEAGLGILQGAAGLRRMWSDVTGNEFQAAADAETQALLGRASAAIHPDFAFDWQEAAYGGTVSATQSIALTPVGRVGVLLGLSGVTSGQAYGRYRGRDANVAEATAGALLEGTIEYATEKLPVDWLFNRFGREGLGSFIGGFFVREFGGEQMATHLQDAVDTAIANPNMTWEQYWAGRPQATIDTAIAVAVMTAGAGGGGAIASRLHREDRNLGHIETAFEGQQILDNLMTEAQASQVRTLDPESFADFVSSRTQGTPVQNVYVPVEALRTYLQSEGAETEFFQPYVQQIADATRLNGDIVIPIGQVAAHLAGTPAWEALREDVRLTPGGMSGREAKEGARTFMQELETRGAEIAAEALGESDAIASATAIYERTKTQLLGLGQSDRVADANAQVFAAQREAAAARMGQTVEAYDKAHPVTFRMAAKGEKPSQFALRQDDAPTFDAKIAAEEGWVYHATTRDGFFNIQDDGALHPFEPSYGTEQESWPDGSVENRSYFGATPKAVEPFSQEDPVLLRTRASAKIKKERGTPDLYSAQSISASELEYLGKDGAWHPVTPALMQDKARGQTQFFPSGETVVTLFGTANLSTLIHELGHVFLEEMFRDASAESAPQELKDDVDRIRAWFAASGHPVEKAIPTEAHELFARGFERYAMEGKAPSAALRGAFAQFRAWLLRIYEVVQNLRAPITPEIREVMNRMLATEAAIEQNQETALPLFKSAEDAQMTDEEFAAYEASIKGARDEAYDALLFKTMEAIRRRENVKMREQRANVRAEAAAQINARPEFIALHLLRTGRWLGDPDRAPMQVKINTGWLIDNYGEDVLNQLPRGSLVKGDGQDGDTIAEITGMKSGDQLVQTLISMRAATDQLRATGDKRGVRDVMIEAEVERVMAARHGDTMTDGTIEEEAIAAINSARQGEIIAGEMRQLTRRNAALGGPTPYQIARQWAKRTIVAGNVRDVASRAAVQRYIRATAKAARLAEEAILKGDVNEAFRQKQAQLLNHALLAESKIAADTVEAIVARMQRIAKQKARKSVDQDYFDRIHELLARFDFRQRSQAAIDEQDGFEEWAQRRRAEGFEVHVPPRLDRADHYSRVPVDILYELNDAVASLLHLGRKKQSYVDAQGERAWRDIVEEGKQSLRAIPNLKHLDKVTPKQAARGRLVSKKLAGGIQVEFLADWMDDDNPNGAFNRVLVQGATNALNTYKDLTETILAPLAKLYLSRTRKQRARLDEKVTSERLTWSAKAFKDGAENPLAGQPVTLTRMEWAAVALNLGTLSNAEKMTHRNAENWNIEVVREETGRILNKEEWDFVDAIWRQMDTLFPLIAVNERELSGVVPEEVEALEVETPYGTYKGGYWPAVRDTLRSQRAENDAAATADDLFSFHSGIGTQKGHTITRTDAVYPMSYDLEGILMGHVDQVVTRIAYQLWVRDAVRLIRTPAISGMIDSKIGHEYRKQIEPWIKRQINAHAIDQRGSGEFNSILRRFRVNLSINAMGFSVATGQAQQLGLFASIARLGSTGKKRGHKVGLQYMAIGMRRMINVRSGIGVVAGGGLGALLLGSPTAGAALGYLASGATGAFSEAQEFIFSRSPEMMRRNAAVSREVVEAFSAMRGSRSILDHGKAMFFWHIGMVDRYVVSMPTWLGAHQKALDEGMTDLEASAYADKIVRTSQGAGPEKDLSAWQSPNSEGNRIWTLFYTPFNPFFNSQWEAARKARNGKIDAAIVTTTMFFILMPLADALLSGDWPDDDEEDGLDAGDWTQWFIRNVSFGLFAGLPIARDAANVTERVARGEYANMESPTSQTLEQVGRWADQTWRISETMPWIEFEDKEADGAYVRSTANAIGLSFGLPGGQVGKASGFIWDVHTGAADPQTIADWYKGITSGTPPVNRSQ